MSEVLQCVGFDTVSIVQMLELGVLVLRVIAWTIVCFATFFKRKELWEAMKKTGELVFNFLESMFKVLNKRFNKKVSPEEELLELLEIVEEKIRLRKDLLDRVSHVREKHIYSFDGVANKVLNLGDEVFDHGERTHGIDWGDEI